MENNEIKTYNYPRGFCLVLGKNYAYGCNTFYNALTELKHYFKCVSKVPLKFLYEKDDIRIFFHIHIANDIEDARGFYKENIFYNVTDLVKNILTFPKKKMTIF